MKQKSDIERVNHFAFLKQKGGVDTITKNMMMRKLILINICLLHSRKAQHILLLMIIYIEKQAKLYIMHVMTQSRSVTERQKHAQITHKQESL